MFSAAVDAGLTWLAVVGAIAAVVAAAYYLRLLASIWFAPPAPQMQRAGSAIMLTATAAAALTFPVLVLALGALQRSAETAVRMWN